LKFLNLLKLYYINCLKHLDLHTSYILQDSFCDMGQLNSCRVCGRIFDSEAELKKHEHFCAFTRRKQYEKSKKI